jgi:hypothetical protein
VAQLDEIAMLDPRLVVPGHRLPGTAADLSAVTGTRDYLVAFEEELARAVDGAASNRVWPAKFLALSGGVRSWC